MIRHPILLDLLFQQAFSQRNHGSELEPIALAIFTSRNKSHRWNDQSLPSALLPVACRRQFPPNMSRRKCGIAWRASLISQPPPSAPCFVHLPKTHPSSRTPRTRPRGWLNPILLFARSGNPELLRSPAVKRKSFRRTRLRAIPVCPDRLKDP